MTVHPGVTVDWVAIVCLTILQLDNLAHGTARWSAPELVRPREGQPDNICSQHTTAHCPTSLVVPLSASIQKQGAIHLAVLVEVLDKVLALEVLEG